MSILLIYHASKCNNNNCKQYLCNEIKNVLYHINKEHNGDYNVKCKFEDCNHIRKIIKHYNKCRKSDNICKKCHIQKQIIENNDIIKTADTLYSFKMEHKKNIMT